MTHTEKCTVTACRTEVKCEKEATFFMASQVMRITLKAYDHQLVDASAAKIIETAKLFPVVSASRKLNYTFSAQSRSILFCTVTCRQVL